VSADSKNLVDLISSYTHFHGTCSCVASGLMLHDVEKTPQLSLMMNKTAISLPSKDHDFGQIILAHGRSVDQDSKLSSGGLSNMQYQVCRYDRLFTAAVK